MSQNQNTMTDKEFKRLKRADLIEIIYRMQENEERYQEAIAHMSKKLSDRQMKIASAGSIAEASVALSGVFEAAQEAADRYLAEIAQMHQAAEAELAQAREEAQRILADARARAGWDL